MRDRQRRPLSLLDDYCTQLGMLLERRYTERALIAAKEKAEQAAVLASESMRQAQAADNAKSHFLATMTHELRTPLNAIIGFSEMLQSAPAGDTAVPTYAGYIRDSGTQLLGMLNGVLDLARIEAGRLTLDEQDVLLLEVLDAAIRPLRRAADEKSISIISGMVVERILRLDPVKVAQVFSNILSNAIKFTPEGGTVEIDSDMNADGSISVWFRDNGPGIAVENIERVLQPFDQAQNHLTRENGGLGVGLPIARALTRMHGGDITLNSQVDIGTTVEIRFPADRVPPLSPLQSGPSTNSTQAA
ncbi:MAG: HAMP domain-containing histidine kinase [Alphaproteobacteria bacterium]|nr:HAMP domain-containing histidine kinase [Alphaproteobacteria bacterium]